MATPLPLSQRSLLIPVHMQHLLAIDGQEGGEDTFGDARTQNDVVVVLIHLCRTSMAQSRSELS